MGSGAATFRALLRGECGVGPLRRGDPAALNVVAGYHVGRADSQPTFRAGYLLDRCLRAVVRQAGIDPGRERVVAIVGTGLGELATVEDWALGGARFPVQLLHFEDVVRRAVPGVAEVITLSNACSAGGHALALAQDLVELDEADCVIVGATDTMTRSMLGMIGKVAPAPTTQVRPFDRDRTGVLLGEGAGALVVVPPSWPGRALARLAGTGLSCDAWRETAPDVAGIVRAMRNAFERANRRPSTVDLVVAHGTGTALNDPTECAALREVVLADGGNPLVTAVKGAVGHTSGSAALVSMDVALRCIASGTVPPVVGLRTVLEEGKGLRFVQHRPAIGRPSLVQVNAFGFGGVNAVSLVEAL